MSSVGATACCLVLVVQLAVCCRTFDEDGKVKTSEFVAGVYQMPMREGSYDLTGDRVIKLGTNMYVVILALVLYKHVTIPLLCVMVRAFANDAMGHQIDPSWGGPIELFLVPASAPRLV